MDRERVVVWTLACVGWAIAALTVSWGIAGAVADLAVRTSSVPGTDPSFEIHKWRLTLFPGVWAALAGPGILVLTSRVLHPVRIGVVLRAVAWLVSAAAIAVLLEWTLLAWSSARFGHQGADLDMIGATGLMPGLVVLTALSVTGQVAAPMVPVPRVLTLLAAVFVLLATASNILGLEDGIDPDSWPLAVLVGMSALYATGAIAFAVLWPAPEAT